jgi:hypothetical protein
LNWVQSVHWLPKPPHAVGSKPGKHAVPSQQPGQLPGPQRLLFSQKPPKPPGEPTQAPPRAEQFSQIWPLMPHSFGSVP